MNRVFFPSASAAIVKSLLVAAFASLLRGGKYHYEEAAEQPLVTLARSG